MTLTLSGDALADKYETKRDGLTLDEALEAAVLGYRVTSPTIQRDAYIHYEFNGWRIQFVHDGKLGSSSGWTFGREDQIAEWSIVPDREEAPKRDAWGKPVAAQRHCEYCGGVLHSYETKFCDEACKSYYDAKVEQTGERDAWGRMIERPINGA